jgi:hypothetical protein
LSAAVYKRFIKKDHKICNKYVEFSPHPKSLDGISKPSNEELTRLGFNDVTTVLANTVEAMENVSSKILGRNNINKIVEEGVTKGRHSPHRNANHENPSHYTSKEFCYLRKSSQKQNGYTPASP